MINKRLTVILTAVLVLQFVPTVHAQHPQGDAAATTQIKADVAKRGAGEKARVQVKLRDQTTVKGYISQAGEDSFTVTDLKTGQNIAIAYSDVAKVKGQGLSFGKKLAIGLGIAAAAAVLTTVLFAKGLEDAAKSGLGKSR